MSLTTSGPRESGVESLFPSPITRQLEDLFIFFSSRNSFKTEIRTSSIAF